MINFTKIVEDAERTRRDFDRAKAQHEQMAIATFNVAITNNKGDFADAFTLLKSKDIISQLEEEEFNYDVISGGYERGPRLAFNYGKHRRGRVYFWSENGIGKIETYEPSENGSAYDIRDYALTEEGFTSFVENELYELHKIEGNI